MNSIIRDGNIDDLHAVLDLIKELASYESAPQIRFHVLDWNNPAIDFYKKFDVDFDPEWVTCRLNESRILNYKSN